ncbi:zinc finger, CCHC-type containing protein [Tanacetum coccineum]
MDSRCKPLGYKWIFKRKMKVDVTIDKFKARLVIQGFRQKEGIDYFDTYAPVARISTIRLLIVLTVTYNLVIHQMDVKITFLNGDLEEEWHQKFDDVVLSSGFILNQSNKTDQDQVDKTKEFLSSNFSMKDTGEPDVILGIRITREDKDQLEYSRAISCLMYTMTSTRPDIDYVVGNLSSWKKGIMVEELIYEIPLWLKPISPISIHCDSAATLAKAYCQIYIGKSRHLGMGLKSIEISNDETPNSLLANAGS